ncbi:Putative uncharacterized protein [Thermotoga neapolitana DSM 4359]|jgi:hypothetical protein|uniref:Uncharacterized protein n=2 Tax=Thermotogaceae TaxID=188709 RepID=B9K774_THENN|nr:Putative uncharacterized protein [Thermotoga neapolitana DSM 4359]
MRRENMRKILNYVFAYLFLAVTGAFGFYVIFLEGRRFFFTVLGLTNARVQTINAVDKFVVIVLGIVFLGVFMFSEDYFRKKAKDGVRDLLRAFLMVSGMLMLVWSGFQSPFFFSVGYRLGASEIIGYFSKLITGGLLLVSSRYLRSERLHTI